MALADWVRIHTDCGISGLGEPYLEDHADTVIAEAQRLVPLLIGEDPTRLEYLWRKLYDSGNGYRGGNIKMSAISGIDMALWDITGKAYGIPIHRLMGGEYRSRVKVYRSCHAELPYTVDAGLPYLHGSRHEMAHAGETMAERMSRSALILSEWGFRCLKLHFAPSEALNQPANLEEMASCLEAIRKEIGRDIDVAVDIHNTHLSRAMRLIKLLEPFDPLFVEEPLPQERIDMLRKVTESTSLPIAVGERWMGKWAFHEALQCGASVLQPDLAHAGGFTELKKIAGMAEASFATMAPHCPLSPLSFAACIQFAAAVPNFLVQEHNEVNDARVKGRTWIGHGFMREPFVLDQDGCVAVPDTPGIGFNWDGELMEQLMKKPWFNIRG